jgi:site-specific DNA recombinase
VLIDDTSRLGRNLTDVLKLAEVFTHYGVSLQFVSPPLNSNDPNFRQLLMMKAWMDEQYSVGLAEKVLRGLEGQVLRGYNAGSAPYGYKNVTEFYPDGKEAGRRLEIIPEQAEVVRRIFQMYAGGFSFDQIAKTLRNENIPAPAPPRKNSARGWSPDGIASTLRNKKYIGIYEWHQTEQILDPETGKSVTRPRPREKWVVRENPDWRILPNELWESVEEQFRLKRRFGISKCGGLNRAKKSAQYILSGLLVCGTCGRSISIVDGADDNVRYGCGAYRYKKACTNSTTIRRKQLEPELLSWLTKDLLSDNGIERSMALFHEQLEERERQLRAAKLDTKAVESLKNELAEHKREADNIVEFIGKAGGNAPASLVIRLSALESQIKSLEHKVAGLTRPAPSITRAELTNFVAAKLREVQAVLSGSPEAAKQILRKHIARITLTPTGTRGTFQVTVAFAGCYADGAEAVLQPGGLQSSLQHYGFSSLTLGGPLLDRHSLPLKHKSKPVELDTGEEAA